MNWATIYLFNAIVMPLMGVLCAINGYHDHNPVTAVCGVFMVLLSPIWVIHWRRAKNP